MESFSLSHAAADILWEDLKLGSRPYPFEVPYASRTVDERARLRTAVYADLESRGLARWGRVDAEAEEALTLLVRGQFGVTGIGKLDATSHETLLVRGGAGREWGALATLDDRMLKVDLVDSDWLISSAVNLLPADPRGPGELLRVPMSAPKVEDDYDTASFTRKASSRQGPSPMSALEAVFQRPRLRGGQFGVWADRRQSPQVRWFTTDEGRYLSQTYRAHDGRDWLMHAPSDNSDLIGHLHRELEALREAS